MKEEAEEENRKKKQHPPSKATDGWTLRDKTWKYISDFCEGKTAMPASPLLVSGALLISGLGQHLNAQAGRS